MALAACGHEDTFTTPETGTEEPRGSGSPVRLTYNERDDRHPAWLPDGSGIIYSTEASEKADHDRCLAILPPTGGQIRRLICDRTPGHDDDLDVFEAPSVAPDGRIVYLHATAPGFQPKRSGSAMVLGRLDAPEGGRVLSPFPVTSPSGLGHNTFGYVRWLSDTRFVYLGQDMFWEGSSVRPDTNATGLEIMQVDLDGETPSFTLVPGTDLASSVAGGGDAETIYFTVAGDSRVYRHNLATGARAVVWDFGAGHIARDVSVVGDRLAAIVDGSVLYRFEEAHGWVQRDEGGDLHLVSLSSGPLAVFASDTALFHRPVISPAGDRLVVERALFAPVDEGPGDEWPFPNHRHDLWLFEVP